MPRYSAKERKGLQREFLRNLTLHGVVGTAAQHAGMSRKLAYDWRNRYVTFRNDWDEAVNTALDRLETRVYQHAMQGGPGDMRTATWLLARLRTDRWANPENKLKVDQEHTVSVTFVNDPGHSILEDDDDES